MEEEKVQEIWEDLLENLLDSRPPDPISHITSYLTSLSLQSTSLSQAVDMATSLQYSNLYTDSFSDQVYEIYCYLTDNTEESLAKGIPSHVYEEFISQYIVSIDEKLLKESLKINLLYPYQQPCCITYNQLKQSITTAVSIREYCRLGRELYHSVNMTKDVAQELLRKLSNDQVSGSENASLLLSQNNIITEEEFLKAAIKSFQQQYGKCKKN